MRYCNFNNKILNAIERIVRVGIVEGFFAIASLLDGIGDLKIVKTDDI
ncbi:hypothetical protein PMEGAPL128_52970 [Priestia megaterium]